jgi:hypothetical protein
MGRKKLDKVRIQIKIDMKINEKLNSLGIEKSGLINQLLLESLFLESEYKTE